ncbi:hypothetical protein D3C81_1944100 [compost metagenome]
MLLGGVRADRYHYHFAGNALFLEAHAFFHRDLAEGVHGHFDVCQFNARAIRLYTDLDVVIYDPLDCYKNLHCCFRLIRKVKRKGR